MSPANSGGGGDSTPENQETCQLPLFSCAHCTKKFTLKPNLRKHTRQAHAHTLLARQASERGAGGNRELRRPTTRSHRTSGNHVEMSLIDDCLPPAITAKCAVCADRAIGEINLVPVCGG